MSIDVFGSFLPWKVQELGLISGEATSKPSTSTCGTAGDRRAARALPEIEVLTSPRWFGMVPPSRLQLTQLADLGTTPLVLLEARSSQFGRFSVAIT